MSAPKPSLQEVIHTVVTKTVPTPHKDGPHHAAHTLERDKLRLTLALQRVFQGSGVITADPTVAILNRMQQVVDGHSEFIKQGAPVLEAPEHGTKGAIAYLEGLKADAEPGIPEPVMTEILGEYLRYGQEQVMATLKSSRGRVAGMAAGVLGGAKRTIAKLRRSKAETATADSEQPLISPESSN